MESSVNPVNRVVVLLFGNPYAALSISAMLLLGCAFIIAYNYRKYHKPLSSALKSRVAALSPVSFCRFGSDHEHIGDDFMHTLRSTTQT